MVQSFHIKIFANIFIISLTITLTNSKNILHGLKSYAGSYFVLFWDSFWHMFLYFLKTVQSFLAKVCTDVFCITPMVTALKDFTADTQHSEDVPLWSYFGQDVPDHNRTKIRRIRFLTYFCSAMSGMHMASGNIEKFP